VTFTLPGFASVKREGVEMAGVAVITINADMRVGTVQETITVTGETPIVDIQSARRRSGAQTTEVIKELPRRGATTRSSPLVPSVNDGKQPADLLMSGDAHLLQPRRPRKRGSWCSRGLNVRRRVQRRRACPASYGHVERVGIET